jgi:hypothetical protein
MKIIPNTNYKKYKEVSAAILQNDGYCISQDERTKSTKCLCDKFRNQTFDGPCKCGRFLKIKEY